MGVQRSGPECTSLFCFLCGITCSETALQHAQPTNVAAVLAAACHPAEPNSLWRGYLRPSAAVPGAQVRAEGAAQQGQGAPGAVIRSAPFSCGHCLCHACSVPAPKSLNSMRGSLALNKGARSSKFTHPPLLPPFTPSLCSLISWQLLPELTHSQQRHSHFGPTTSLTAARASSPHGPLTPLQQACRASDLCSTFC